MVNDLIIIRLKNVDENKERKYQILKKNKLLTYLKQNSF